MELTRLGKYEINGLLGRGGMGAVYRGWDPLIQRTVAIKTVARELLKESGEDIVERFRNEARAAGRLTHSNIVAVYEYGEDGDMAYIAMEYVEGVELKEYLKQHGKMPVPDAIGVVQPILDALAYAHEQGVTHRDIKPANLILTNKGKIKIADFGIARIESSSLTQVGMMIGTPCYMSPEQFLCKEVDGRSDIYATGVLLFELLSGKRPFEGGIEIISHRVCQEVPPAISQVEPSVPSCFDAVINQALSKKPEDRFQTADAFSKALQGAFKDNFNVHETPSVSDETIVFTSHLLQTMHARNPQEGMQTSTSLHSPKGETATHWQETTLHLVERQLASFIGPMAKTLVKRAAIQASTVQDLYQLLATNLEQESERAGFLSLQSELKKANIEQTSIKTGSVMSTLTMHSGNGELSMVNTISQAIIERITTALMRSQGPISRVLVQRAAKRCSSEKALVEALANDITDSAERASFLREVSSTKL